MPTTHRERVMPLDLARMKLYMFLLPLLVSLALAWACVSDQNPGFGIYLVDSGELVLSEDHIKTYYQDTHTIELNEAGVEKWNSYMTYTAIPKLDACLFSEDFVLKVEGDEIYRGKFYSMASSITCPGVVIMDALLKLDAAHNTITIELGHPGPSPDDGEDPRDNPRVIRFFERKGLLKHEAPQLQPTPTEPATTVESPPEDTDDAGQWKDFWSFSTGDNYEGYHLETGSTIYHLKGGITRVYGPDNELIMCVNDAEVKQVPVPGGKGPQPATHVLNVPNGSVVTHDGFVTRAAGLTVVDMATDSYGDKFVDREAFEGFWQATGGDTAIPESEWEPGKICSYNEYSVRIAENDRAVVIWDNGLNQSRSEGTINEDEIIVSIGSAEAIFRFHDETTAFAAFYDDDRVYVKQLTRQQQAPIEIMVGVQIKPQPGECLSCADGGSSGVVLNSANVETVVSEGEYFNPVAGPQAWKVKPGDLIVVVNGEIENINSDGPYVAIWAEGYDAEGNIVSWTLDADHVAGQSQVYVGQGETKGFTLHLSFAEDLNEVEIIACAYSQPPP